MHHLMSTTSFHHHVYSIIALPLVGTYFSSDITKGASNACAENCSHLVCVLVLAAVELSVVQRINSNKISANEILCNKYTFLWPRSWSSIRQQPATNSHSVWTSSQPFSVGYKASHKTLSPEKKHWAQLIWLLEWNFYRNFNWNRTQFQ